MFKTRCLLAVLATVTGMSVATASTIDAGATPESARKSALHLRVYNEQPKEAFDACRGRRAGVPCSYSVSPPGTGYVRRVEGTCWAPETPRPVAPVCR